jgi:hypothetical protein
MAYHRSARAAAQESRLGQSLIRLETDMDRAIPVKLEDLALGRFVVRSAPRPAASLASRAAGVALPPIVRDAATA